MQLKQGYIQVRGGKVWYEIKGRENSEPLIVIHGGPGYPHFYLEPISDLSDKRQIIFYDQLGCGNSKASNNRSLWTIKNFVNELETVIQKLGLKKYHILGHSWGATVAVAFALKKPSGLISVILSDPYISTPIWERDARMRIKQLPKRMQKAINTYEKERKVTKAYKKASREFYTKFVFGFRKLTTPIKKSTRTQNRELYNYMWGPEEYWVSGTLKKVDLSKRLKEIRIPVLLLCGYYDEASPDAVKQFKKLLPDGQMKLFMKSAHFPFWTERKQYVVAVRAFLNKT